jgi:hypothetical protein
MAGHFAGSVRLAADDLDRQSPALAGLVRNLADKVEEYAGEFEGQTIDQLARTASDFTRRQPALVFGLAALAGFFMLRTMRNAQNLSAPSIQPTQGFQEDMSHG